MLGMLFMVFLALNNKFCKLIACSKIGFLCGVNCLFIHKHTASRTNLSVVTGNVVSHLVNRETCYPAKIGTWVFLNAGQMLLPTGNSAIGAEERWHCNTVPFLGNRS